MSESRWPPREVPATLAERADGVLRGRLDQRPAFTLWRLPALEMRGPRRGRGASSVGGASPLSDALDIYSDSPLACSQSRVALSPRGGD